VLHSLQIKNFAIVEHLTLQFSLGLTVITGETGAGKSILMDALSLVLGERADSTIIREGCETAHIAAKFTLPAAAKTWLDQHLNLTGPECEIRRIIYQTGRSKAYLNDHPVSLQILRQLSDYLIDIHGQHAHQSLLKHDFQRQLLDDLAPDHTLLSHIQHLYQEWKTLRQHLQELGGQDRDARLALLNYQVQELAEFELTAEAIHTLETEHRQLANLQKLLDNSQQALQKLDAEEGNAALTYLTQAQHHLQTIQAHDDRLTAPLQLLENALIQTQEAVGELQDYLQKLDRDPQRLDQVERKIAALQDLARKHKVRFTELPDYFNRLCQELQKLQNYEEHIRQTQQKIDQVLQNYRDTAETLHQQRINIAQHLGKHITASMQQLGMPKGHLLIAVTTDPDALPSPTGWDEVEFLVSTNPGQAPKPLHKIASGGELSRISLAIQVIASQQSGVPTLVFDEVDVGIGGSTAEIVGQLLKQLGQQRQVFCITHLPQVACQGHHHLQVTKTADQHTTHTHVKILQFDQRVEELARMLGGLEITTQTIAYAQDILQRCHPD